MDARKRRSRRALLKAQINTPARKVREAARAIVQARVENREPPAWALQVFGG